MALALGGVAENPLVARGDGWKAAPDKGFQSISSNS